MSYSARIDSLRNLMSEKKAGAALITSSENRFYFSGFTGSAGCLLVMADTLLLLTDSRYTVQAKIQATDYEVVTYTKDLPHIINTYIGDKCVKSLLFEDRSLTVSEFKGIQTALSAELLPFEDSLQILRLKKSRQEAGLIYEAVRLADDAFTDVLSFIKEGVTEAEVAARLEGYMRKNGASGLSFDTICASGIRSAMPHGTATQKPIEKGDFLTLDFGCVLDGYCSDITRTVVIGKATKRQEEIYNMVLYAQTRGINAIYPGIEAAELDRAARSVIEDFGFGDNFGHSLGHGVGIEVHEKPVISSRSADIVSPGAVITVEPGIYIEGFGGVRIEDMVYVSDTGYTVLTASTKELIEL
jgi:Xaa-Pro aminopeptidase